MMMMVMIPKVFPSQAKGIDIIAPINTTRADNIPTYPSPNDGESVMTVPKT